MSNTKLFAIYFIFFVTGILSLLYYDEIFVEKEVRSEDDKVATAVTSVKDVKYRSKNSLNWYKVTSNEFFIDGDKIFTGDKSELTLETVHKNQINIEANSLIKLRGGLVSLNRGQITAFINKKMVFYINGKKVTVKPNEKSVINIQKIEGQGDILTVTDGSVLLNFNGKNLKLTKDQKSKIDQSNILKRTGLKKIKLRTVLVDDAFLCQNDSLKLEWDSVIHVNHYRIRIFADSSMNTLLKEFKTKQNKIIFPIKAFKQELFITILGYKKGKEVSQLELKRIVFIAKNIMLNLKALKKTYVKGTPVEFKKSEVINKYLGDVNFYLNIKHAKRLSTYRAQQVPVDSIYIDSGQNRAVFCFSHQSCGAEPICKSTSFLVRNSTKPAILYPRNNQIVYTVKDDTQVDFVWTIPSKLNYKDLELHVIVNNDVIVYRYIDEYKSGENITDVELGPGKYSWRILGLDQEVPFKTKIKSFEIIAVVPPKDTLASFIKFNKKSMQYLFQWEQEKIGKEKMVIEYLIKNKKTSVTIKSKNRRAKRQRLTLPVTDSFKWRLRGQTKLKSIYETNWNEVLTPTCAETASIPLSRVRYSKKKPVIFKWPKVLGAHHYILKIFQFNENSKEVSYTYEVNGNAFTWKEAFSRDLSWTVTPVDIAGRKCTTSQLGLYKK